MSRIVSHRLACVAVAGLLSVPALAVAQPAKGPEAAPPGVAAPATPGKGAVGGKRAQERVQRRIDELHAELRITPDQQPQWDKFAQVMRDNARDMDQAFTERSQKFRVMNAVENMQSYEQIAEDHSQHLQKLVSAFQNLYDSMSAQQKQVADQVFRERGEEHAARHRKG
jgi:hypothetical protein